MSDNGDYPDTENEDMAIEQRNSKQHQEEIVGCNYEDCVHSYDVQVPICGADGLPIDGKFRTLDLRSGTVIDPATQDERQCKQHENFMNSAQQSHPKNDSGGMIAGESFGIPFLKASPVMPSRTVKIQLSGPIKFSASMACHEVIVHDLMIVVIVDKRVKEEVLDISIDNSEINTSLVMEDGMEYCIEPPIPTIISYDVGVIRHFVFIRRLC